MSTINQGPNLHTPDPGAHWSVSTITAGQAVIFDSGVPNTLDYVGVQRSSGAAKWVIGIALEGCVGTAAAPQQIRVADKPGFVMRVSVEGNVAEGNPLSSHAVAGQLVLYANTDTAPPVGVALTAEGVLMDGTVEAGYCSIWKY